MDARPVFRAACMAVVAALWASRVLAAPVGAPEKVRIDYAAPPACPDRDAFLTQVRARVGTEWEAPPSELAHTIDVRVLSADGRSVARIEFVDARGEHVARTVAAATCAEVVSGIALVTALAIESRVSSPADGAPPSGASAASGSTGAPEAKVAVSPPASAPAREAPGVEKAARRKRPPAGPPPHWDVGGAASFAAGVGPVLAYGPRVFAGVGWEGGPDFRLGVDSMSTPWLDLPRGGPSRFSLLGGRASGCPWAFGVGAVARVLPCVGLAAGVRHGEARGSRTVRGGSADPSFLLPFVSARADATFEILFVELEVEGRFVFSEQGFSFKDPPQSADAYPVPAGALGLSLGLGLRL